MKNKRSNDGPLKPHPVEFEVTLDVCLSQQPEELDHAFGLRWNFGGHQATTPVRSASSLACLPLDFLATHRRLCFCGLLGTCVRWVCRDPQPLPTGEAPSEGWKEVESAEPLEEEGEEGADDKKGKTEDEEEEVPFASLPRKLYLSLIHI